MKRVPFVICYLLFVISGHAQSPIGVQEPAWSPDGKRIAVSYLDRLWSMTPDGKQARAITQNLKTSEPQNLNESVIEREPAWAPDGNRIAYAAIETVDERKKVIPVDDDQPLSMRNLCHSTEKCPLRVPLHPGAAQYYRKKGYL